MKARYLALALPLLAAAPASACSLCIAHAMGGGLFGLGAQNLPARTQLFGLTTLGFTKSNAGEEPGTTEKEDYRQTSLEYSLGLTQRALLRVSLPIVSKRMQMGTDPAESANGFGDAVLGGTLQLPPRPNQKVVTAFSLDVKLPTGSNNAKDSEGARKEEHLQLGTGSTDFTIGVAFTGETGKPGDLWFGGLRQRVNGSNSTHFHYGDVTLYSAGWAHALNPQAQAVVELNGRIAAKDRTADGTHDPNSGGHLGYLSLSYRQRFGQGLGAILTLQQPVLKQLHGTQDEKALVTLSVTRSF